MSNILSRIDEAVNLKPSHAASIRKRKMAEIAGGGSGSDEVIRKVVNKLRAGESQLKHIIEHGYTIEQVIWAIKHRKCVANLGSTYLEQTISGTIQDLIKDGVLSSHLINDYRKIFGLPPLDRENTRKREKSSNKQRRSTGFASKIARALK